MKFTESELMAIQEALIQAIDDGFAEDGYDPICTALTKIEKWFEGAEDGDKQEVSVS